MSTILAETLSGDWAIIRDHPEDADTQIELARFHLSVAAEDSEAHEWMIKVICTSAIGLDMHNEGIKVQSHNLAHVLHMQTFVTAFDGVLI